MSKAARPPRVLKSSVPVVRIGCAGWSIPAAWADRFPVEGTHLERYAAVFNAVEINSSFYRTHRPATYARWHASVPDSFRFSVKMPRTISHDKRLTDCTRELDEFLGNVEHLATSLGCVLLQLPRSFSFDEKTVVRFFGQLRKRHDGPVACEPRHASWFNARVDRLLRANHISRVGADPSLTVRAVLPTGDQSFEYLRLHGSPRIYHDAYSHEALARICARLERSGAVTRERWCIFDNTASGHATGNAITLIDRLRGVSESA